MATRILESGAAVNPDNMLETEPQSTTPKLKSLRSIITEQVKAINAAVETLDIRVGSVVTDTGAQSFQRAADGSEGRPLFFLSYASFITPGARTRVEGNSTEIQTALRMFTADKALRASVKNIMTRNIRAKLDAARDRVKALEAELAETLASD